MATNKLGVYLQALKKIVQKKRLVKKEGDSLTFLDHLEELRSRLIQCIGTVLVLSVPCFIYWRKIFDIVLVYPLRYINPKPHLIFTAPTEAVMISMEIAVVGGIILSSPLLFHHIWRFISPGLYKNEKRIILPIVISSTFSFLLGIAFSYVIIPLLLKVLSLYGVGVMEPYFKVKEYISFIIKMSLSCGFIFELPVISYVLTKMGLITPQFLVKKIRHAVVLSFVVAAIVTPPDVLSQVVMAIPLLTLFGISILVSYLTVEKKK